MKEVLLAIAIGAASGAVAALCGVGGGIIMVPLFVLLLGLSQKTAVATSLAAIIITALLATAKNQANAFVDWKIAIPCALAGGIVASIGSVASPSARMRSSTSRMPC